MLGYSKHLKNRPRGSGKKENLHKVARNYDFSVHDYHDGSKNCTCIKCTHAREEDYYAEYCLDNVISLSKQYCLDNPSYIYTLMEKVDEEENDEEENDEEKADEEKDDEEKDDEEKDDEEENDEEENDEEKADENDDENGDEDENYHTLYQVRRCGRKNRKPKNNQSDQNKQTAIISSDAQTDWNPSDAQTAIISSDEDSDWNPLDEYSDGIDYSDNERGDSRFDNENGYGYESEYESEYEY